MSVARGKEAFEPKDRFSTCKSNEAGVAGVTVGLVWLGRRVMAQEAWRVRALLNLI